MIEKLLLKLRLRDDVSAAEERTLRDLVETTCDVAANRTVVREGETLDVSVLLLDGLMCRYRDLRDGARQIAELHVAGDFVDLHGFTLKTLDHNVMTLSPCRIAFVPHERLQRVTEEQPHLTRLLWFSTNLDAAIHREWVMSLGRRSALSRLAHLFCELKVRLEIIGLTDGLSYDLDLTQLTVAECLGLTPVHVNRTLRQLRETGAVEFRSGRVTIHDWDQLTAIADFEPNYLHLRHRAR